MTTDVPHKASTEAEVPGFWYYTGKSLQIIVPFLLLQLLQVTFGIRAAVPQLRSTVSSFKSAWPPCVITRGCTGYRLFLRLCKVRRLHKRRANAACAFDA
jgi:hypothetical protein